MIISDRIKILDQGNCDFVRDRGKEAYVKSTSLRTETFYKAGVVGELAPTQRNPRFNHAGKERGCGEEVYILTGGRPRCRAPWVAICPSKGAALSAMPELGAEESAEIIVVWNPSLGS